MINDNLIDIFDDCISRLDRGETIDDCLQAYPQYANELHPMLEAIQIPQRAQVSSDEVTLSQARVGERFEQALNQPMVMRPTFPFSRVAAIIVFILFVGSLLTTGVVIVAQDTIPGDNLYGVKRFTEQVRLALASDETTLQDEFALRRIDETKRVLEIGRETQIEFAGVIDAVTDTSIIIAGLDVQIDPMLRSINLMVGMRIDVEAQTQVNRTVVASAIRILDILEPVMRPDVPPTLTEIPATSMPTLTSEAVEFTATTQSEIRITPTHTPEQRPTLTPMVRPTEVNTVTARPDSSPTEQTPDTTSNSDGDCRPSQPDGWVSYTIQAGDTPSGIAVGTDLSLDDLYRVNCNLNPRLIVAGDVIYVPFEPRLATTSTATSVPTQTESRATATPASRPATQETRPTESDSASSRERIEQQRERQNNSNEGGEQSRGR